jgi:hypothetical protein
MNARIGVVEVEQMLAAGIRGGAELVEERGELGVGHRPPVDPERLHGHIMRRPLVGQPAPAAHRESAAGKPHHIRIGVGSARRRGGVETQGANEDSEGGHFTAHVPCPAPQARPSCHRHW